MKTAATRERSSPLPVSFSTIEASVTNSLMSASGRSGARRSQMSSTSFFWSASILSMICWRVAPRVKRCVSVARLPSGGMSPACRRSARHARRCAANACSTVSPSGMVSEYSTDLPLFRSSMMSRIEAPALISYSPAFSAAIVAVGAHADAEDAGVADQSASLELVGDIRRRRCSARTRKLCRRRRRAGAVEFAACRNRRATPAARTSSITEEMTKFMNTTSWLRDARERFGGGVPRFRPQCLAGRLRHDRLRRRWRAGRIRRCLPDWCSYRLTILLSLAARILRWQSSGEYRQRLSPNMARCRRRPRQPS